MAWTQVDVDVVVVVFFVLGAVSRGRERSEGAFASETRHTCSPEEIPTARARFANRFLNGSHCVGRTDGAQRCMR